MVSLGILENSTVLESKSAFPLRNNGQIEFVIYGPVNCKLSKLKNLLFHLRQKMFGSRKEGTNFNLPKSTWTHTIDYGCVTQLVSVKCLMREELNKYIICLVLSISVWIQSVYITYVKWT